MKLFRNILTGIFAVAFTVSTVLALSLALDHRAGHDRHAEALALASGIDAAPEPTLPDHTAPLPNTDPPVSLPSNLSDAAPPRRPETEPTEPEAQDASPLFDPWALWLDSLDLEALQAVNSDVIGWIMIPGTEISYPIVQGPDNDYYLDHTWDGQPNAAGAVFMEASHAADFSDFSTILYAHNLRSGAMFTALHNYKEPTFWEDHPFVYIVTETGSFRYRIYAAYEADVTGTTYWQTVPAQRQQEYVQYGLDHSVLETGVIPDPGTSVLTLSTCTGYTYARRWVVQAVLEGPITGTLSIPLSTP